MVPLNNNLEEEEELVDQAEVEDQVELQNLMLQDIILNLVQREEGKQFLTNQ